MFLYLSVACIQVWYSNNFCILVTPHHYIMFLCLLILILNFILVKLVLSFLSSFLSTYSSTAYFISQIIKQLKCIFKSKHHRKNLAPNMCLNLSPSLFIIKVFSAFVFSALQLDKVDTHSFSWLFIGNTMIFSILQMTTFLFCSIAASILYGYFIICFYEFILNSINNTFLIIFKWMLAFFSSSFLFSSPSNHSTLAWVHSCFPLLWAITPQS